MFGRPVGHQHADLARQLFNSSTTAPRSARFRSAGRKNSPWMRPSASSVMAIGTEPLSKSAKKSEPWTRTPWNDPRSLFVLSTMACTCAAGTWARKAGSNQFGSILAEVKSRAIAAFEASSLIGAPLAVTGALKSSPAILPTPSSVMVVGTEPLSKSTRKLSPSVRTPLYAPSCDFNWATIVCTCVAGTWARKDGANQSALMVLEVKRRSTAACGVT